MQCWLVSTLSKRRLPQSARIVSCRQWELYIDQKVAFASLSDVFYFAVHELHELPTHAQAKSFLRHASTPVKHLMDELLWKAWPWMCYSETWNPKPTCSVYTLKHVTKVGHTETIRDLILTPIDWLLLATATYPFLPTLRWPSVSKLGIRNHDLANNVYDHYSMNENGVVYYHL